MNVGSGGRRTFWQGVECLAAIGNVPKDAMHRNPRRTGENQRTGPTNYPSRQDNASELASVGGIASVKGRMMRQTAKSGKCINFLYFIYSK